MSCSILVWVCAGARAEGVNFSMWSFLELLSESILKRLQRNSSNKHHDIKKRWVAAVVSFSCWYYSCICIFILLSQYQRWSRRHKAWGQGHKKIRGQREPSRGQSDPLEAKDRNTRGQGQGRRTQAQLLSKKKVFKKIFQAIFENKKRVFKIFFQKNYKILTIQI